MNRVSCIIIDDEIPAQERLISLLKKFEYLDIVAKINDADEAIEKIINLKPDLIFLDVEIGMKTGFDVLDQIRKKNVKSEIIFVTGFKHYAIKAIRKEAFDYLPKPIDVDDLNKAMERFSTNLKKNNSDAISTEFISKYGITETETKVIKLLLKNFTSQQIADNLFISPATVSTHRKHILRKTSTNSTPELISLIHNYK